MLVLALDTALTRGGVALARGEKVLAAAGLDPARTHSASLLEAVDAVLAEAGAQLKDLDGLAVTVGPGYFTGLRIGLATALGLALGLGLKMAGLSSLRLLAAGAPEFDGDLWALADARRGLLYAARYRPGRPEPERMGQEMAISPDKVAGLIKGPALLVGDGARQYFAQLAGGGVELAPERFDRTDAGLLARLGAGRLGRGLGRDPGEISPSYLRPSDAEVRFGLPLDEYRLVE